MASALRSLESFDLDNNIQEAPSRTGANADSQEKPATGLAAIEHAVPRWLRNEKLEWRRRIQNFTPSWFSVTMGTGIVSILLHTNPYATDWLRIISIVVFCLNILIFSAMFIASLLRYILYPQIWILMLRHPTQSLFLGTLPMGFATIVNMFVLVCVPKWGSWAVTFAWTLWWIDAAVSMTICLVLPFLMMHIHNPSLSTLNAAWLLPVVAPIVAAASGATVAPVLQNPQHALWTLIASYIMLGAGLPTAVVLLVIYFRRLLEHKLPPREMIVSTFLPLGPFGQGGYAFMNLGKVALEVFPKTGSLHTLAGDFLYMFGFTTALLLWGFGLVWLFLALASISRYRRIPFNVSWWAATFPWGVFATSTMSIGEELPSSFFKILGVIFSGCVILLWLVVMAVTVRKTVSGEMFISPCVAEAKQEYEKSRSSASGAANTTV